MTRIEICKNIIQSIKDYITNPTKIEAHRVANHFVRKRKLSMLHVINYLLYSSKASMYNNLSSIINDLPVSEFPNITKQALSKARQFINFPLFRELFNLSVDTFYSSIENRKTWQGYHLFAIDGSRIELPCFESNYEYFGKMYTIKDDSGNKKYYTQGLTSDNAEDNLFTDIRMLASVPVNAVVAFIAEESFLRRILREPVFPDFL